MTGRAALPHPFGACKKRLLAQLPPTTRSPALLALFPELQMVRTETEDDVLQTVISPHLVHGDQSAAIIEAAREELVQLGIWERRTLEGESFVVEELANQRRAALFLATHYYKHAMFQWFWQLEASLVGEPIPFLKLLAVDVAAFDGRAGQELEERFADLLQVLERADGSTPAVQQRLYNKYAVLRTYRREFAEAEQTLRRSWQWLAELPDEAETRCRQAEWHNAKALIYYRTGAWEGAMAELRAAERCLAHVDEATTRAVAIREIVSANRQRLLTETPRWSEEVL